MQSVKNGSMTFRVEQILGKERLSESCYVKYSPANLFDQLNRTISDVAERLGNLARPAWNGAFER